MVAVVQACSEYRNVANSLYYLISSDVFCSLFFVLNHFVSHCSCTSLGCILMADEQVLTHGCPKLQRRARMGRSPFACVSAVAAAMPIFKCTLVFR